MAEETGVTSDSLGGRPLIYSNERRDAFHYTPPEFEVRVTGVVLRRVFGLARRVRLIAPPGWTVAEPVRLVLDPARTVVWRVRPGGLALSCLTNLRLVVERADGGESEIVHAVPIEVRGRSQFDPRRHALPFANSAIDLGPIDPSPAIFAQTYQAAPLAGPFFDGLYSEVVHISDDPRAPRPGGLCTGIARSALEFSLRHPDQPITRHDPALLRRQAMLWHGKQLADRALLASTAAWVGHGSRDAYLAFREQVLAGSSSDLAMDVNVPRPWRRDLFTALIGSGHTVVPYALRQHSDDHAEVWVYDPNHPRPEEMRQSVIHFDLARDTYQYRHVDGSAPGRPSKVLAVRQSHYRAATTGVLGGLISLLLYPRARPVPAPLAAVGMLLALLLNLLLGRGPLRQPAPGRATGGRARGAAAPGGAATGGPMVARSRR
jgi:hypothetical protein